MTRVNLTSTSGSGFLETDFDQIKDLLQDGGVEGVTITASALVTTAGINVDTLASSTTTNTSAISLNTTHRSSNGTDHSYINQSVTSTASPTFANVVLTGQANSAINTLSDAATITPDWDNGSNQTVTLGGNRTIANGSNKKDGATYTLILKQDGTGSRTVTWGSEYLWSGGTAPTLTTTASAVDIVTFVCDGTSMFGVFTGDFS